MIDLMIKLLVWLFGIGVGIMIGFLIVSKSNNKIVSQEEFKAGFDLCWRGGLIR